MIAAVALISLALLFAASIAWAGYRSRLAKREIVSLLSEFDDASGLELAIASKARGGILRRGTVYIALNELEGDGIVASKPANDGTPRRLYWLASGGSEP